MTKGHFQFYRPRASVTLTAAQDAHTYCGHMFPQPLGLGVHARWLFYCQQFCLYLFFALSPPTIYIYIYFGFGFVGFGFGFPIFISPSKVSMREREHDRDLLPLDVNYALLDSLENRPEKGLSGNLSPSYSLCAYQFFLECSLFIIWLFIDFRSPPPGCTLHKNSHLCALFPASAPAPRPLLDKTIIVVVCVNLHTQYAKLIN